MFTREINQYITGWLRKGMKCLSQQKQNQEVKELIRKVKT